MAGAPPVWLVILFVGAMLAGCADDDAAPAPEPPAPAAPETLPLHCLGRNGIEEIIEVELDDAERKLMDESAEHVRANLETLERLQAEAS